jgi:hypothetical protein
MTDTTTTEHWPTTPANSYDTHDQRMKLFLKLTPRATLAHNALTSRYVAPNVKKLCTETIRNFRSCLMPTIRANASGMHRNMRRTCGYATMRQPATPTIRLGS